MSRHRPAGAPAAVAIVISTVIAIGLIASPALGAPPEGKGGGKGKNKPTPTATETTPPPTETTPPPTETTPPPTETTPPPTETTPPPTETTPPPDPTDPPPTPDPSALPAIMAGVGDSITVAYDADGSGSFPQYSWSTGSSSTVQSHATRLVAAGASGLVTYNDAVVGAQAADLAPQVNAAISQGADYLTVQIGANDACTGTVGEMTSVGAFSSSVAGALGTFADARPDAEILLTSIPNLKRMWALSKDNGWARFIWSIGDVCQSMLENPTSTTTASEERRDTVQARVDAFNGELAVICAALENCSFDDYRVADFEFTSSHISTFDYFHPSVAGQAKLAEITWPYSPYAG
ncbi:GDSL-type esterase/lipase family protein [Agromyces sp. SYSU T00194]|uniref:GDSL-type esterase/lipase family protein n=1 Tax=Agromyces chitinivorans TaxID=3158560 RepID=UPI0033967910